MTALISKLIVKQVESILKGRVAVNSQQKQGRLGNSLKGAVKIVKLGQERIRAVEESVKVTSRVDVIKVIVYPSVTGRNQPYILLIFIPYS